MEGSSSNLHEFRNTVQAIEDEGKAGELNGVEIFMGVDNQDDSPRNRQAIHRQMGRDCNGRHRHEIIHASQFIHPYCVSTFEDLVRILDA
eukprot:14545709-Ditylum_brightwellii.AAC.2